jgi:hypothetical protein
MMQNDYIRGDTPLISPLITPLITYPHTETADFNQGLF